MKASNFSYLPSNALRIVEKIEVTDQVDSIFVGISTLVKTPLSVF